LFQGMGDGSFAPNQNMDRAMFAQVIYNMAGRPGATGTGTFNDVQPGAWYSPAVTWAAEMGIVQGHSASRFSPYAPITREEMAVMIVRYANIMGAVLPRVNTTGFADQNHISPWAQDAIADVQAAGIIMGRANGNFDPSATATRAEVSAVFSRLLRAVN